MKLLLILMIILSFISGVPTNMGWFTLFGSEFTGPISMIAAGTMPRILWMEWIFMVTAHVGLLSLPFLTAKKNFGLLLVAIPMLYLIAYLIYFWLFVFLFIPYIIVWIVAILKQYANLFK